MKQQFSWDWLAGLADGEGCFTISQTRGIYTVRFELSLRADDVSLLENIRTATGLGVLKRERGPRGGNDMVRWSVNTVDECLLLEQGFESGCGLRSKKARDYQIWRRALHEVDMYGGGRFSDASERLAILKAEMHTTKAFAPELATEVVTGRGLWPDKSRERKGRSSKQFWDSPAGIAEKQRRWGCAIITDEQREVIRTRYRAGGISQTALGNEYGVDQTTISRIVGKL